MLIVSGATMYAHVAAGWETTKLLPAIVNVADLDCVVVLAVAQRIKYFVPDIRAERRVGVHDSRRVQQYVCRSRMR
jgi:hypothetical protein